MHIREPRQQLIDLGVTTVDDEILPELQQLWNESETWAGVVGMGGAVEQCSNQHCADSGLRQSHSPPLQ